MASPSPRPPNLATVIARLEREYPGLRPPPVVDPFGLVVWENVAYPATYRSVMQALEGRLPRDPDALIDLHLLLRRHGETLCRRSAPRCDTCPLRSTCAYAS
jgi:endonuclease III-like uncharacterized protein